jgi:hypothetical protein
MYLAQPGPPHAHRSEDLTIDCHKGLGFRLTAAHEVGLLAERPRLSSGLRGGAIHQVLCKLKHVTVRLVASGPQCFVRGNLDPGGEFDGWML